MRRLSARDAVDTMRTALVAHATGEYLSPPRSSATLGETRMMFGAGGARDGGIALRVSGGAASPLEHVTMTWLPSGEVDAIIFGNMIGARRSGAVAAVAVDALAPLGDLRVGILGSGRNGWAQIWGLTGVRQIAELAIYSLTIAHREAFAERARARTRARGSSCRVAACGGRVYGRGCFVHDEPRAGDRGRLDSRRRAVVSSIGAKTVTAHETPTELLDRMSWVVSEAPDEITSPISDLANSPLFSLGALLTGRVAPPRPGDVSLFLYSGLGGADAAYAQAVARLT